jgi:hypothetical protein
MMKIAKIEIRQRASYEDYANQLAGTVQLQGDGGKQEILLSSKVVSEIFKIIREDLVLRSQLIASQTSDAVDEAIHSPLLESQTNVLEHSI